VYLVLEEFEIFSHVKVHNHYVTQQVLESESESDFGPGVGVAQKTRTLHPWIQTLRATRTFVLMTVRRKHTALRYTYDTVQVFVPPRRAGMPRRVVRNAEAMRHVTFYDLALVLGLLGTRHIGQSFRMRAANVRLLLFSFLP